MHSIDTSQHHRWHVSMEQEKVRREHRWRGTSETFHYVFVGTTSQRCCQITRGVLLFLSFLPVSRCLSICLYRDEIRTILLGGRYSSSRSVAILLSARGHAKKVTGERQGGGGGEGRERENRRDAQWIKNEDKSVCPRYRCCRADGNAGKFGREAHRSSLEQQITLPGHTIRRTIQVPNRNQSVSGDRERRRWRVRCARQRIYLLGT